MANFNFDCPYCGRATTVVDSNYNKQWNKLFLSVPPIDGELGFWSIAVTCPNVKCKKLWLKVGLTKTDKPYREWVEGSDIQVWQLLPESEAKILPNYIPKAIQNDYYEACRIRDLSAKASATLSRRCLQGIIRDFHGITKKTLKKEIDALKGKIDPLTWKAIEVVRKVGNIGAHMEKDINVLIDVEPNEAQLLIGLIERLVSDWYIQRFKRQEQLDQLSELATKKDVAKKSKQAK